MGGREDESGKVGDDAQEVLPGLERCLGEVQVEEVV